MTFLDQRFENISVAVIAGGKSSRFGSPKAEAVLEDRHLVDYAIQLGYRISREVFLVTANPDPFENPFAPAIRDLILNCGPLGGIMTAMIHSGNPWISTLPCDMPLVSSDVIRLLINKKSMHAPVVAVSEKGLEPLLSVWPVELWPYLYQQLRNDRNSIRSVLRELNAIEVYVPGQLPGYHPQIFTNINYKEDLQKISGMRPAV